LSKRTISKKKEQIDRESVPY